MFSAMVLRETPQFSCKVESIAFDELKKQAGNTLIKVHYSTLNYKDALAVTNKGQIARHFPMIPGIDLAGEVIESESDELTKGDRVFINGLGMGENHYGGFSQFAWIDAGKLLKIPASYNSFDVMALGTAGYTAALCVNRLLAHGVKTDQGPILVSGATGGVGLVAIMLLSKLGFTVIAMSSKKGNEEFFQQLGAASTISSDDFKLQGRALQKATYQAAIDVVGSSVLANICAQVKYDGIVAACGLAGGMDLPATVAPFILRNITLAGVDSVMASKALRLKAWELLESLIPSAEIAQFSKTISLQEVIPTAQAMIKGQIQGRFVIEIPK